MFDPSRIYIYDVWTMPTNLLKLTIVVGAALPDRGVAHDGASFVRGRVRLHQTITVKGTIQS